MARPLGAALRSLPGSGGVYLGRLAGQGEVSATWEREVATPVREYFVSAGDFNHWEKTVTMTMKMFLFCCTCSHLW